MEQSYLTEEDAKEIISIVERMTYEVSRNFFTFKKLQERLYKKLEKLKEKG